MQLDNPPTTVSPEEYFRYYCKDSKAIEMFHQYTDNVLEGDTEETKKLVKNLEREVEYLKEEIDGLEDDNGWLRTRLEEAGEDPYE